MYFSSKTDPNYRVKGSRDPLGFQSLWSNAGHKAVKHLSTVSANLKDFMILSYGHYFYENNEDSKFLNFFLKFEQVCAYARKIHLNDNSFNGTDFVNKQVAQNRKTYSISLQPTDTLLSNQRAYGIYGKYIRPFRDMEISKASEFKEVMEQSLSKTNSSKVNHIIKKLLDEKPFRISEENLKPFAQLIETRTTKEKEFYIKYILQVPNENHPQNNLYDIVHNNRQIAQSEFNLHSIIQTLQTQDQISEGLKLALEYIRITDRVLLPLNRCFSHLLSQALWTEEQIDNDTFLGNLPPSNNYPFANETMDKLNQILSLNGSELVDAIIERNKIAKAGSGSWIIRENNNQYKVIYGENGQKQQDIDFDNNFEFFYFLNTWLNLFKQIELN